MMTALPGLHPDSSLYRTILSTFAAACAPKMVLQVAVIMVQQVSSSGGSTDSDSSGWAFVVEDQGGDSRAGPPGLIEAGLRCVNRECAIVCVLCSLAAGASLWGRR